MALLAWPLKRWASRAVVNLPPEHLTADLEACGYTDVVCSVSLRIVRISARGPTKD
jgi:hypothetical protein